jgi:aspartyl-tRNA(Asn)/glutamyl-tRNA(Gln) amidotransferase subunit A
MADPNLDLSGLTAGDINAGITAGDFSAAEVTAAAYERIEAIEDGVHAFLQLTPELAHAAAADVDAMRARGDELPPFTGVPLGIKDNMNLIGSNTTCASRILGPYRSVYNATAVQRMLDAGAIPIGKCNMDEFAFGSSTENSAYGVTHNPWDLERVPGGSSGGSAAAVAAGEVVVSLGSDTGGSIRQPGALTGTVALKPTYGRVSRYGLVAFASSLDQIGPFSKTVRESAAVLDVIGCKDPMDATSVEGTNLDGVLTNADIAAGKVAGSSGHVFTDVVDTYEGSLKGMKVAVARDLLDTEGLDPAIKAQVEAAAETAARLGAEVGEVTLPHATYGLAAYYIIGPAEASSNLARFDGIRYGARVPDAEDVMDLYLRTRAQGFGPETIRRVMIGTYALSAGYYDAYYGQAQKVRTLIMDDFKAAFADYDVILTPTSPTTAFKIGEKVDDPLQMYLSDVFTIPVNLAGIPGISVPIGLSDGLPVGLQVLAGHFREAPMFRVAHALAADVDLDVRPPLVRDLARG